LKLKLKINGKEVGKKQIDILRLKDETSCKLYQTEVESRWAEAALKRKRANATETTIDEDWTEMSTILKYFRISQERHKTRLDINKDTEIGG
jgi:hypothetical protein